MGDKAETLQASARYRTFVADRDHALERIHQNAQIDLSRILSGTLEQVEGFTSQLASHATRPGAWHVLQHHFEQGTGEIFSELFQKMIDRIKRLRRAVFVLTYASEREAVARGSGLHQPVTQTQYLARRAAALTAPTLEGALDRRIWHCCLLLRGRLVSAFNTAVIRHDLKAQEVVDSVRKAFPKIEVYARAPKALTKLREGDSEPIGKQEALTTDYMDDGDWQTAVDAYKGTELPPNRFDRYASYDPDKGMMRYEWEGEQEATEDFVKQVRDGQIAAARDTGVKDFVWVAILDNTTCETCCVPRNGKTLTEIAAMDDDCDSDVPPAHFNCRCQIAPVASTDEVEGPDWASFNDWLET